MVVKLASSEDPMDDFEYAATMEVLLAVRRAICGRRTSGISRRSDLKDHKNKRKRYRGTV